MSVRRYGCTKVKSAARATNTGPPTSHQRAPSTRADPHHDHQRRAHEQECAREAEPAAEGPLPVALVRDPVPPLPPEPCEAERELHEPHEPEPEHPEQQSGADPPGRRLAGEAGTTPRVHGEHRNQRELGQQPDDPEEALERAGTRELVRGEEIGDAHLRQPQRGGHAARSPEHEGK